MKATDKKDKTTMFSGTALWSACPHERGWYFTIYFWIFKKKMFWCDVCHNPLDLKQYELERSFYVNAKIRNKFNAKKG